MSPEQWVGIVGIAIGVGLGVLTLRLLWVWSRYRPPHSAKCNGYLRNRRYSKEKWIGHYHKRKVKDWVDYAYTYTVDGELYFIEDGVHGKNENIPKTVTVIYQKKHPKRAYIERMTFPTEPVFAVFAGFFALLFWVCGVALIF
ncbi:MAG: hypothetical protein E7610_06375 [Ruminococcaceae bacterium]|nr:hypothetical protein [Oscillospiraceae bacterium]